MVGDFGLSRLSTLEPIGVSQANNRSPPPAAPADSRWQSALSGVGTDNCGSSIAISAT